MWPFSKKYPSRSAIKLVEELCFVHTEEMGKPLVARFNAKAKPLIGHPEFANQASISVVLNTPAENGLTRDDENEQLRAIEAQIRETLEAENESLQVGAITTNGKKSYIYYTADPEGILAKFTQLCKRITTHRLEIKIEPDAGWGIYKRYVQ